MSHSDVGWVLSNQRGVIWSGTLSPSDFVVNATSTTFRYKNLAAKTAGGIFKGKIRISRGGTSYGFKVQAYTNDPSRRFQDLSDIQRILRFGQPDRERVREYFRLFDREKDLEALLTGEDPS